MPTTRQQHKRPASENSLHDNRPTKKAKDSNHAKTQLSSSDFSFEDELVAPYRWYINNSFITEQDVQQGFDSECRLMTNRVYEFDNSLAYELKIARLPKRNISIVILSWMKKDLAMKGGLTAALQGDWVIVKELALPVQLAAILSTTPSQSDLMGIAKIFTVEFLLSGVADKLAKQRINKDSVTPIPSWAGKRAEIRNLLRKSNHKHSSINSQTKSSLVSSHGPALFAALVTSMQARLKLFAFLYPLTRASTFLTVLNPAYMSPEDFKTDRSGASYNFANNALHRVLHVVLTSIRDQWAQSLDESDSRLTTWLTSAADPTQSSSMIPEATPESLQTTHSQLRDSIALFEAQILKTILHLTHLWTFGNGHGDEYATAPHRFLKDATLHTIDEILIPEVQESAELTMPLPLAEFTEQLALHCRLAGVRPLDPAVKGLDHLVSYFKTRKLFSEDWVLASNVAKIARRKVSPAWFPCPTSAAAAERGRGCAPQQRERVASDVHTAGDGAAGFECEGSFRSNAPAELQESNDEDDGVEPEEEKEIENGEEDAGLPEWSPEGSPKAPSSFRIPDQEQHLKKMKLDEDMEDAGIR